MDTSPKTPTVQVIPTTSHSQEGKGFSGHQPVSVCEPDWARDSRSLTLSLSPSTRSPVNGPHGNYEP